MPVEEPSPRVLDWEASSFSVIAIQANSTLRRPFDQRTSVGFLAPKSRCDCRAAPKEKALFGAFVTVGNRPLTTMADRHIE